MSFCGMRGTVPCSGGRARGALQTKRECTALEDFVHALTAGRAPTTGLHGALCLLERF